jgi:hypothetical protein
MSEHFSVVYLDDEIDVYLSKYLCERFQKDYSEVIFRNGATAYQDLVDNPVIRNANILIVDSKLFENRTVKYKITGEELKMAFRKVFPFMEIIVITQNDYAEAYDDMVKYRPNKKENYSQYYDLHLKPAISTAERVIEISRKVIDEINGDSAIDSVLIEKLRNEIDGIYEYKEMGKEDVDELIAAFKEMKKEFDNGCK